MKIEKSDIRVSKLNDQELINCLEVCKEKNPNLTPWINDLIYHYDPQSNKRVMEVNRYWLQSMLDGVEFGNNGEYIKTKYFVPEEVKQQLNEDIAYKEKNLPNSEYSFLSFSRIDYNNEGEKFYTPCVYNTQEEFFKNLNDIYENNIDRYYNSPEIILGTNLKENQEFYSNEHGEKLLIGSQVEDVRINGYKVLDDTDIYSMINYVCNNYRDTEIYSSILGVKEVDIYDKNDILTMPGGLKTSFQEIQNTWGKKIDPQFIFYAFGESSEMVHSPINENETDWKIIKYTGNYKNNFNDQSIFVLRNNYPVHAFLVGSEHSHLYTNEEKELLRNLAEDYIVKQVMRTGHDNPMRIDMAKYALLGDALNGNGMKIFTVPVLEIEQEQRRIMEKNQVIINIPEKPEIKDFINDFKKLITGYEQKGISKEKINQTLNKIFANNNNKTR